MEPTFNVVLTQKQIEVLNEALGHALTAQPVQARVAIAANLFAPIVQAFQSAKPVEQTVETPTQTE